MTPEESCKYILENATDPMFNRINWDELKQKGVVRAVCDDPHIAFRDLEFPTPSGKIEVYTEALKEYGQELPVFVEPLESNRNTKAKEYPLTFMNTHDVYSAHSQHRVLPWMLEVNPKPLLEMHPKDAFPRDIKEGDIVKVFNDRGSFEAEVILTEAIKPGALNLCQGWWPEHFEKGHHNDITHLELNRAQEAIIETNFSPYDNLVEVERVGRGGN